MRAVGMTHDEIAIEFARRYRACQIFGSAKIPVVTGDDRCS